MVDNGNIEALSMEFFYFLPAYKIASVPLQRINYPLFNSSKNEIVSRMNRESLGFVPVLKPLIISEVIMISTYN